MEKHFGSSDIPLVFWDQLKTHLNFFICSGVKNKYHDYIAVCLQYISLWYSSIYVGIMP